MPYLREALQRAGKQCAAGVLEKISRQPGSLAACVGELDKAAAYAGTEAAITMAMADAVLTPSIESNIFHLVDALGRRHCPKALQELRALLDNGESPFAVFAMMLRQYRLIFRAKACLQAGMGRAQIAQTLKVQPFVAENAAAQSKQYTFAELEDAMELFCDKDLAMKSSIPPRQALEDLVIGIAVGQGTGLRG
jgi:DNA polymerase-3 subunit delta